MDKLRKWRGIDNIDIFNNSAIILEKKVPKRIVSWITILISLTIVLIFLCFYKFNIYVKYVGIYKDNTLIISNSFFPLNKNNRLYIENKKYDYEIIDILSDEVILKIKLNNNLKINKNKLNVYIFKYKKNIYTIIKNKWKDAFCNEEY